MKITGLGEIAERLRRVTVLVRPQQSRGNGSGVLWSSHGLIVTNAHVARSAHAEITLWDGRELRAEVMARDPRRDLAALQISSDNLPSAEVADSSRIRAGEIAIAVGNPLGFVGAMTTGLIQGVGPIRGLGRYNWVQSDVRLAPGNSGGPLTDVHGRVIGINTMIAGRVASAIASNEVLRFLRRDESDNWLGITVTPVRLLKHSDHKFGLVVVSVEPGSPAASASLMAGDILLGTDAAQFQSVGDLLALLQAGQLPQLRLQFFRGDYSRLRRVTVLLRKAAA